jgi:hypothetical protein
MATPRAKLNFFLQSALLVSLAREGAANQPRGEVGSAPNLRSF